MGNKLNGYGVKHNRNGDYAQGDFKDNLLHGHGTYAQKSGHVRTGNWENGKFTGYGSYESYEQGQYIVTEGDFINGKLNGHGKVVINNKYVREGEFSDNQFTGFGSALTNDLQLTYEGNFAKGKRCGFGKEVHISGRYSRVGEWKDDFIMKGYGSFLYGNGHIYEGEWKNDKRHGKGLYIEESNKVTYGIWAYGRLVLEIPRTESEMRNFLNHREEEAEGTYSAYTTVE